VADVIDSDCARVALVEVDIPLLAALVATFVPPCVDPERERELEVELDVGDSPLLPPPEHATTAAAAVPPASRHPHRRIDMCVSSRCVTRLDGLRAPSMPAAPGSLHHVRIARLCGAARRRWRGRPSAP
jgi:hypothetical protein